MTKKTLTIQTTEEKLIDFIKDYINQEADYQEYGEEGRANWEDSALEIIFGDKAEKFKELVDNDELSNTQLNKSVKKIIKELNLL